MSNPTATDDKLFTREQLLELLPEAWPGLSKALKAFGRDDPLSVAIIRKLLASAAVEIRARDDEEKRRALLDLLDGAVVTREQHDARVTELLDANNVAVGRLRKAMRERDTLRALLAKYGDRVRMASAAENQDVIDRALGA